MAEPIFEWDQRKNIQNQQKHGVLFEDAQAAFLDPHRLVVRDTGHVSEEERYYCIGKAGGGILTVRFTMRGERIRIIGAGYWRKGRKAYA